MKRYIKNIDTFDKLEKETGIKFIGVEKGNYILSFADNIEQKSIIKDLENILTNLTLIDIELGDKKEVIFSRKQSFAQNNIKIDKEKEIIKIKKEFGENNSARILYKCYKDLYPLLISLDDINNSYGNE